MFISECRIHSGRLETCWYVELLVPLLSTIFIAGGIDALRNPAQRAAKSVTADRQIRRDAARSSDAEGAC